MFDRSVESVRFLKSPTIGIASQNDLLNLVHPRKVTGPTLARQSIPSLNQVWDWVVEMDRLRRDWEDAAA